MVCAIPKIIFFTHISVTAVEKSWDDRGLFLGLSAQNASIKKIVTDIMLPFPKPNPSFFVLSSSGFILATNSMIILVVSIMDERLVLYCL